MSVIGTWDDVFGAATPEVQSIASALRSTIRLADPQTVETARPGENAVTFGTGPAKMKEGYAYLMPLKSRVNLGFYAGAALNDPTDLLEGTGKSLRHIKVTTLELTTDPALTDLIRDAAALKRAST